MDLIVISEAVAEVAHAAGLPLIEAELPWPCSNEAYESRAGARLGEARDELGAQQLAFGDLYLEDVRAYRQRQADEQGLKPVFPLWQSPTAELARQMIDGGLKAVLTCVDPQQLPADFAGRHYDIELLDELPAGADPCGEGGEFHTFAYAGPMFRNDIAIEPGVVVERGGFVYADVVPANAG